MRLSYTAILLVFGISSTIEANQFDTNSLTTVQNTYAHHHLGNLEPVRFRKRGTDDVPASVWEFDVSNPNDFCYNPTETIILWRPDAGKKGEELKMVKLDSEQEYSVTWPTKRHTMAWPSSVSLVEGEYLIGIGNATNKINLHKIPDDTANVKNWMESRGCIQQLEMLKETKSQSAKTGI